MDTSWIHGIETNLLRSIEVAKEKRPGKTEPKIIIENEQKKKKKKKKPNKTTGLYFVVKQIMVIIKAHVWIRTNYLF